PVRPEERISALDSIRGFALLGILLMNITAFGLPAAAYENPVPAGGHTGKNLIVWVIMTVAADGKMRAIFSLAFGASVYLLVDRLIRKGAAAAAADIHYRRMLWLLLFGLIHGYLIWSGDILYMYAMCGLVLYPLRKLSPRVLLTTAAVMLVFMGAMGIREYFRVLHLQRDSIQIAADEKAGKKLTPKQEDSKKEWEQVTKDFNPSADVIKQDVDAHLGGYFKLLPFRAGQTHRFQSTTLYENFDIVMMMLVGMALMKLGVLTGSYSTKFYVGMALVGFGVGLPSDILSVWWVLRYNFSLGAWYITGAEYEFGRFTAFGYIAVILLLVKSGVLRAVTDRLGSVGRMAFSNYILTSLICTTIFEGYGFGLFDKLQRNQLYYVVAAVWLIILVVSPIWLRHFRFGPLEWLWRSLTYWKKQPFRIAAPVGAPAATPTVAPAS
ncbi:MAG: DUF418 domain-containing protein, partial [Acidobacteria bacterium]|nr:DUF418 domain-containing protein [Acidobacteriota bacterium]